MNTYANHLYNFKRSDNVLRITFSPIKLEKSNLIHDKTWQQKSCCCCEQKYNLRERKLILCVV